MRYGLVGAAFAAALLVAGCVMDDGPPPTPRSPLPTTAAPAPSDTPANTLPMPSGAHVSLDASLLAVLPAAVGGVPVNQEPDSFAEAIRDPSFVANVDRAVFAIAVSGNDLASGVVAHLRPGVWSDAFFRDWRDSYNEGACAQSGGVAGNAEAKIGDRTVFIGTCAGGLRTYHAWIEDRGVVVSAFSLGERRLGEQLMAGLRP